MPTALRLKKTVKCTNFVSHAYINGKEKSITAMMIIVYLSLKGIATLKTDFLERYIHALAGFIIAVSGLSIQFLGL